MALLQNFKYRGRYYIGMQKEIEGQFPAKQFKNIQKIENEF